jgi:hypothetical protein
MSNNSTLRRVFREVQTRLDSGKYTWISEDNSPEDYFDWGLNYATTADSIIDAMIDEGDLEAAQ